MIRQVIVVSALLISATVAFSGTEKGNEAEFFAGVTLLQQQKDLKPVEKALKFRELEAMTGISAAKAKIILLRYRERPAEWQKIYNGMAKLLNETNLGLQKSDSLRTAVKDTSKKTTPASAPKLLPPKKNKR
jgi:hypothetical protein